MENIFYFQWEVDLITWLQKALGTAGTAAAKVASFIGGETFTLLLLIVMLFCYRKEAGKRVARTVLTASMMFPMIKNIVLRVRPYMAHEEIDVLQVVEADADPADIIQQGFSFPSGHSATAVSLYGSIGRELKKKWMWTLVVLLALLIGVSRFIVGVHYPTDVLAGWAVGFAYFTALGLLIAATVAFPYEEKYIRFRDTRNPAAMVLRCVGAFAIYFALNTLLKMPFSKEFLDNGTLGANLIRTARYAVILFVVLAVYPRVFPVFEKIRLKK